MKVYCTKRHDHASGVDFYTILHTWGLPTKHDARQLVLANYNKQALTCEQQAPIVNYVIHCAACHRGSSLIPGPICEQQAPIVSYVIHCAACHRGSYLIPGPTCEQQAKI